MSKHTKPKPARYKPMLLRLYAERVDLVNPAWGVKWRAAVPKRDVISHSGKPLWYFIPIIIADARHYKVVRKPTPNRRKSK